MSEFSIINTLQWEVAWQSHHTETWYSFKKFGQKSHAVTSLHLTYFETSEHDIAGLTSESAHNLFSTDSASNCMFVKSLAHCGPVLIGTCWFCHHINNKPQPSWFTVFFYSQHSTFGILMSGCWMSSLYFMYCLKEEMKWLWSEYRNYLVGKRMSSNVQQTDFFEVVRMNSF